MALSFLALLSSMGIRGSFGTYVTPWETTFGVTRGEVSTVSFVSLFVYGASMAVAGRLADRFGPRIVLTLSLLILGLCMIFSFFAKSIWHIMIFYGLIGSIGFGFASNVTVSVAIVRWFKKRKGLMISIVVLGMAAGPMIFTPLALFMIDWIGWRWSFLFCGLIYVFLFAPLYALFFRDQPKGNEDDLTAEQTEQEVNVREEPLSNVSPWRIFRHPVTWMIIVSYVVCGFTDVGLIQTHFIPLGESWQISKMTMANVFIVYGIFNILGTVLVGYVADVLSPKRILFCLHGLRLAGVLLLYFFHDPVWLFVFVVLYGMTDISTVTPYTMLCTKIYGEKQMGSSFGLISFFHQIGGGLGSLVPGFLFMISSGYASTLWVCIGLLALSCLMIAVIDEKAKVSLSGKESGCPGSECPGDIHREKY